MFENGKSWNFPKMHSHKHAFADIQAKGVTRNYNTKTNEKLHGPIKDSYHLRTNFRNVAVQILKADHISFASLLIRRYIDDFDDYEKSLQEEKNELQEAPLSEKNNIHLPPSFHHTLGSVQRALSISTLEENYSHDLAFKNL